MDHLLELVHRLPQARALGVDRGIVHQQLVLAVAEAAEDLRDVRLRAAIFVEIAIDRFPNGMIPRSLRGLVASLRVERLDRAAKLGQVGADAGVLVDRLDRPVEEAVGRAGGLGDLLAAHGGQLIDLLAEFRAVAVERRQLVDELRDALVELAVSSVFNGTRPGASAGAIGCSASGGSSLSLVAVLVSVRRFGGHRHPLLRLKRQGRVNGGPAPRKGLSCIIGITRHSFK